MPPRMPDRPVRLTAGPEARRRGRLTAAGSRPPRAARRRPWPAATMERMFSTADYRKLSFWLDTVPGSLAPGRPLASDVDVDVAIAGAGYTGLWTAYYLSRAEPGLKIAVCEREIAGFGASGRNGGWCSALFPASLGKLERMA